MLLFILSGLSKTKSFFSVSIHLMLLFIMFAICFFLHNLCFNTSHVTLYHISDIINRFRAGVSIHLMLLFISVNYDYVKIYYKFQYISCYSLSQKLCQQNAKITCFNTSHVTLYPVLLCLCL